MRGFRKSPERPQTDRGAVIAPGDRARWNSVRLDTGRKRLARRWAMSDEFSVSQYNGGRTARLVVRGVIDLEYCPALLGAIVDAAGKSAVTELVVDLRQVPILTAVGIRTLLEGQAAARRHDCGYRVVNTSPIVERVLRITGLTEALHVGADRAAAER